MATNHAQDGNVLTLIAPAGGVKSGGIYAIDQLVVVATADAAAGEQFSGRTGGVWRVETTGELTAGAAVALKAGKVVAVATEASIPCGKLVTDAAGGFADLLLSN